jgi:PAS domain S-box-containing protein
MQKNNRTTPVTVDDEFFQALLASEEKYRELAESAIDAIYEFDLTGTLTYSNKTCLDMFGYTLEETIGKLKVPDLIIKEDMPASRAAIGRIMQGKDVVGERTFVRRDGSRFVGEVHSAAVLRDGHPVGIRGIIRDITARREAEARLRESEYSLRQVVEQMPYPMEIYDADGTVKMINRATLELFGLKSAESLIDRFKIFDDPIIEKKGLTAEIKRAFAGETVVIPELRIGEEDISHALFPLKKHDMYFEVTLFPVLRPSGGVWRVVSIRKDITLRKQMEEELIRTQKLESLGLLAGGIAHDFNNLLTAILGYIDLARAIVPPGDPLAEYLDKALTAFPRAKDLTRQLLVFSRGDVTREKTVSVETLLRESAGLSLSGANVRCEFSFAKDLRPVSADEGQLRQVFSNLLINARQAMPEGGVVSVDAENVASGRDQAAGPSQGSWVRITIRDRGIGIPWESQGRIFDPFYTTKKGASGLGLSISHSIVKKHGGRISFVSRPGEGSSFSVFLPGSEDQPLPIPSISEDLSTRCSGSVLVMDDEESVRNVTVQILKSLGYSVTSAREGGEAAALYVENLRKGLKFDAVILDMTVVSGVGGLEAGREILGIDPSAVLIVSSGYSEDAVMSNPSGFGFSAVIPKPYTIGEMKSVLEHVIAKKP